MAKKGMIFLLVVLLIILSACNNSNNEAQINNISNQGNLETKSSETEKTVEKVDYDPFGKYDELVTMSTSICVSPEAQDTLGEGDTPSDNIYTRAIAEEMNIMTTSYWTVACTNLDQKMSLAIASNDLPDAMRVNKVQLRELVEAGQLEEMTEAVKYASPLFKQHGKQLMVLLWNRQPLMEN